MKTSPQLALSTLFMLGIVAMAFSARCGSSSGTPVESEVAPTEVVSGTQTDVSAGGPNLPSAFAVSTILDWSQTDQLLGFRVLKSPHSNLNWPDLVVQPALGDPSIPRKAVTLYTVDGVGVRFTIAPLSTWQEGALQSGETLDVGGRTGWVRNVGADTVFAFACGHSIRFGDVWCLVEIGSHSRDLLAKFVSDLVTV